VGPLELGYLAFCFVACNSITLLDFPNKLIALPRPMLQQTTNLLEA